MAYPPVPVLYPTQATFLDDLRPAAIADRILTGMAYPPRPILYPTQATFLADLRPAAIADQIPTQTSVVPLNPSGILLVSC